MDFSVAKKKKKKKLKWLFYAKLSAESKKSPPNANAFFKGFLHRLCHLWTEKV